MMIARSQDRQPSLAMNGHRVEAARRILSDQATVKCRGEARFDPSIERFAIPLPVLTAACFRTSLLDQDAGCNADQLLLVAWGRPRMRRSPVSRFDGSAVESSPLVLYSGLFYWEKRPAQTNPCVRILNLSVARLRSIVKVVCNLVNRKSGQRSQSRCFARSRV